jgi:hypothetical protein
MNLFLIRKLNTSLESEASANRFAGLVKVLAERGKTDEVA